MSCPFLIHDAHTSLVLQHAISGKLLQLGVVNTSLTCCTVLISELIYA